MELIFLFIGLLIGVVGVWLIFTFKMKSKDLIERTEFLKVQRELDQSSISLEKEKEITNYERVRFEKLEIEFKEIQAKNTDLESRLTKARTHFENQNEKLENQKKEVEELQNQFKVQFENIAGKILKENSEQLSRNSLEKLNLLLNPFKEDITNFKQKIDETNKQNFVLKEEVKKLADLNLKMSEEANNLTKALKSDNKKQGNWGEVILERVLERSGLVKGSEYEIQYSTINDEGSRIQPDVIVNLPDNKHIIIDSKVSLVHYERFVSSEEEDERKKYLAEHINSIKAHIKGLSAKNYPSGQGLNSPEFVLLFVPIEPSFSLAVQEDQELFNFAWDQKIVLVSPSTLLATLSTIASIWKQEKQNKNAIEIARQGGALYDKFAGFITDMQSIGKGIATTQKSFDAAMNKLSNGSGNLVGRAEKIKQLGAKASKSLPEEVQPDID